MDTETSLEMTLYGTQLYYQRMIDTKLLFDKISKKDKIITSDRIKIITLLKKIKKSQYFDSDNLDKINNMLKMLTEFTHNDFVFNFTCMVC